MSQKLKYIIGISVILGAFGFLMLSGYNSAKTYYMTIDEVMAKADNAPNMQNNIKIVGKLVGESVKWDPNKVELKFDLLSEDSSLTMPVIHKGIKPDNFDDGIEVIVEGKYTIERIFVAEKLMTKCPSKYEEQD